MSDKEAEQAAQATHETPVFKSSEVEPALKALKNLVTKLSKKPAPKKEKPVKADNSTEEAAAEGEGKGDAAEAEATVGGEGEGGGGVEGDGEAKTGEGSGTSEGPGEGATREGSDGEAEADGTLREEL